MKTTSTLLIAAATILTIATAHAKGDGQGQGMGSGECQQKRTCTQAKDGSDSNASCTAAEAGPCTNDGVATQPCSEKNKGQGKGKNRQ